MTHRFLVITTSYRSFQNSLRLVTNVPGRTQWEALFTSSVTSRHGEKRRVSSVERTMLAFLRDGDIMWQAAGILAMFKYFSVKPLNFHPTKCGKRPLYYKVPPGDYSPGAVCVRIFLTLHLFRAISRLPGTLLIFFEEVQFWNRTQNLLIMISDNTQDIFHAKRVPSPLLQLDDGSITTHSS